MPFGHQVYQTRKLNCNHSIPFLDKSIISLLQYFLQTLWSCWNILEPGIINYLMNSALVNHYWVYEGPLFHCHRRCVGSFHGSGILHSEASFGWSEVRWAQLDFTCWKFLSYGGEVNSLDYHQIGFFSLLFFQNVFFLNRQSWGSMWEMDLFFWKSQTVSKGGKSWGFCQSLDLWKFTISMTMGLVSWWIVDGSFYYWCI